MLDRETLRGVLGVGFLIGGAGLVMVFAQPPGSAEFVLSLCSAMIGGALVGGVIVLMRLRRRGG